MEHQHDPMLGAKVAKRLLHPDVLDGRTDLVVGHRLQLRSQYPKLVPVGGLSPHDVDQPVAGAAQQPSKGDIGGRPVEQRQEHILGNVLGYGVIEAHPVDVAVDVPNMGVVQHGEVLVVRFATAHAAPGWYLGNAHHRNNERRTRPPSQLVGNLCRAERVDLCDYSQAVTTRILVVAACALLAVGCIGGESGDSAPVLRSEDSARALRFLTVSESTPPPCGADAVEDNNTCLVFGPLSLNSSAIESASVEVDNGIVAISPVFTESGIEDFNVLSAACFQQTEDCASGRIAILTGEQLLTAPVIQAPMFARDQVNVTGNFTVDEAEKIVDALNGDG